MRNNFSPESFFNLSQFEYSDIFQNEDHVWNAIKKIPSYLALIFERKLRGNYAENIWIGEGVEIDPTARIEGPAIIQDHATIGFQALIRGNVIVGKHSVIGHASEIKNSILFPNCKAAHFNYVSDSILGNGVRLGVGSVIVNKRVDRGMVSIKVNNSERIDTQLKKFGSIIGDETRVGANAVINPGTIIGKNTLIYPLESVYGVHNDNEIIK